jgi:hypothetical protein
VGLEGFFGVILSSIVIVIASNIPCVGEDCPNGYYESFQLACDAIF